MKEFFDSVRGSFGPLKQSQVDGLTRYLTATEGLPPKHRAYIIATVWHETGPASDPKHMTPRYEKGPRSYFDKYEPGTRLGRVLGNTIKGDGYKFRGTGDTQNTGRANFVKIGNHFGVDLVSHPEKLLEPEFSAKVSVFAMTTGLYTGKKLADYDNYKDMRRTVNGTDRADLIASYAMKFELAIRSVPQTAANAPPAPKTDLPPVPAPVQVQAPASAPPVHPRQGWGAWLASLFKRG